MSNRTQIPVELKRRLGKKSSVAKILDLSIDTIDRYIKAGKLRVIVLPSGRHRIDLDELDRLIDDWKAESR